MDNVPAKPRARERSPNRVGADGLRKDELATHLRLFVASKVLQAAIEQGELIQFDGIAEATRASGSAIAYLADGLTVQRGGEGSAAGAMVLRAEYCSSDPEESAAVLGAVYAAYRSYTQDQGANSSDLAVELITEAQQTHERELRQAEAEYRHYVADMPVLLEDNQTQEIHKQRLTKLETELAQVRSKSAEAEARLRLIETQLQRSRRLAEAGESEISDMNLLALLSENEMDRLRFFQETRRGGVATESFQANQPLRAESARANYNRLLDLIQKEKTYSQSFGEGHPMVEIVRREIDVTQKFIADNQPKEVAQEREQFSPAEMVETYVKLLRNDVAEYQDREKILLSDSRREMVLAKAVEEDFMKADSLRSAVRRAQQRYDSVIERLQELNLSKSYAGLDTDLLAPPLVAGNPSWPKIPLIMVLGLFAGCGFGSLLAIAAEYADTTFAGLEDLETTVRSTVIAHVPRFNLRKIRNQVIPDSSVDCSVVTHHDPAGAAAEIYRIARTAVMIDAKQNDSKLYLMTSPQPGDGKSTTIANLATSIARTGKKVLLVDADLRRPMQSSLLGIEPRAGLSDVLRGNTKLGEAITETQVENLSLMPHGHATEDPAELLESPILAAILRRLATHYDLILIDAPPLLAVTDPAIIASSVDSVLLTVRVEKNGRGVVEDAVRILHDMQIHPGGIVVNGVQRTAMKSYYHNRYERDQSKYVGKYSSRYRSKTVGEDRSKAIRLAKQSPREGAA